MRVLVFGDVHANESNLDKLLGVSDDADEIVFLGDLQSYSQFRALLNFKERACKPFYSVRGNHEQWWSNYIFDGMVSDVVRLDEYGLFRDDSKVLNYLKSTPLLKVDEQHNIAYIHSLPVTTPESVGGPYGAPQPNWRKIKYHEVWAYTFQTINNSTTYLQELINDNFKWMRDNKVKIVLKGHEHVNRIFLANEIIGAEKHGLAPQKIIINEPAIISIADITRGNYAILDIKEEYEVEFKKVN